jgi:Spy/CpxP family protein refolding chaperone
MFFRTLAAVALAGTVVVSGTAFAQAQTVPANPSAAVAPAPHHQRGEMRMFDGLGLTPDQTAKIQAIQKKYRQERRHEIMAVLTPEQQQRLRAKLAAMRARQR